MIKAKKLLALLLAVAMVAAMFVGCRKTDNKETTAAPATKGNDTPVTTNENPVDTTTPAPETTEEVVVPVVRPDTYVRAEDEDVYMNALPEYEAMLDAANELENLDDRFVAYAKAEAYLLSTGVMAPYQTQGGVYRIGHQAYRTTPYAMWGNDDDRMFSMVIANELIKVEDWDAMKEMWNAAAAGEGTYDAAAYLTGKGYTLNKELDITFSTPPVTIDWLNTSAQADTEITVNCVDGLVQYDNLGVMQPALAESWEESDDGLTYTFHIRQGVKWYTSEGAEYAELTAKDFEAGFHHMLDAAAGLEWLVQGKIAGVDEYLLEGGSWDNVGYKAVDDYTLEITLVAPLPYFMTMLTYSCFLPICDSFYQAHGGVYGIEEFAEASLDTNTYTFGKSEDVASQVYSGPFLLQKLQKDSEIVIVTNPNYYNAENVTLESVRWIYDNGENPNATYNDVVKGVYAGMGLTQASGTLDLAKADGNFEKYAYVSETTSTTYFGGLNLNRGTFALESGACASPKTEQQKADTVTALNNKDFRKALQFAWDKQTMNATSRGEDLAATNLRNMYTHPEFVSLSADTTDADGHTFPAGTFYGEMVQYYLDQMDAGITVADACNGWYNPESAKAHLEAAKEALGDTVTFPIYIDVVYYGPSEAQVAQAQAYKQTVEAALGTENVVVNLIEATTSEDFYACGYRASNGEAGNFDMFYGSGWGPDFGDPCTYLDTFAGYGAGYMTKVIGLF